MLYFPQLLSGATVQYPVEKRHIYRTITNILPDGRCLKLLDAGAGRIEWRFTFEALSEAERAGLEEFFRSVEGRLGEFTLLDPTCNLLEWSENLASEAWTKGPLITTSSGVVDPRGGTAAWQLANSGAASQSVQQNVNGPGWFLYCFSLYAKSDSGTILTVFRSAGSVVEEKSYTLGPTWKRLALSGASQTIQESVTFGVSLAPGAAADVYGFQAEAQPAPSAYRKTTSRSGVHSRARFDDDSLALVADGAEQHSCTVRIVTLEAS